MPLVELLTIGDAKILQLALDSLQYILRVGAEMSRSNQNINPYAVFIEEAEGVEKIESLQNHENAEVYRLAFFLIDRYFCEDDKMLVESVPSFSMSNAPMIVPDGGFQFN